jgi:nickel-dependent lactate racemase
MIYSQAVAPKDNFLTNTQLIETIQAGLKHTLDRQRVLVLIPDHTRSLPLPFLFRTLVELLRDTKQLDFMVALGTHPSLDEESLNKLVGINIDERATAFQHVGLLNHAWNKPSALATIGALEENEIKQIAGENWHESLPKQVSIRINKAALEYDHILIVGPTSHMKWLAFPVVPNICSRASLARR